MSSFRNEAWIPSDIADRRRLGRRAHSTARRVWRPQCRPRQVALPDGRSVGVGVRLRVRLEWRKTEAFTRKEGSWTLVTLPPPPSLPQCNRQRAHGRRRILPNRPYVAPCARRRRRPPQYCAIVGEQVLTWIAVAASNPQTGGCSRFSRFFKSCPRASNTGPLFEGQLRIIHCCLRFT